MAIKVAGDQYQKSGKYYEQQMRHLIVDGIERYRLVVGTDDEGKAKLVYAKGKIHLD